MKLLNEGYFERFLSIVLTVLQLLHYMLLCYFCTSLHWVYLTQYITFTSTEGLFDQTCSLAFQGYCCKDFMISLPVKMPLYFL